MTWTSNPATRNLAAALVGTTGAVLIATAALGAAPADDGSGRLGTVELGAAQGTGTDDPIFASATTSAPCPDGYGSDALLRVGPPGGPYTNLARPLIDGGYDRRPVSAQPNRSFAVAIGGTAPSDGEWWVVVECFSELHGQHPQRFATSITVTGDQWRLTPGGGSAAGATATPAAAAPPTPAPASEPAADPGDTTPDGVESTAPGDVADDPALSRTARSGPASAGVSWWWLAVLIAAGAVIAVVVRVTRTSR
ncbi:hypothetical protein O7632_12705 [Solwaraspora sp. WMMD406]|uniref:hypothetical protein n=1 Tax=Solwaraspora sp. WMMD406 TaxID=3016095 RepID=UPI0024171FAE|nr:hypothetical protein [Solwaraspora sp. WMMD406]MDG4764951.1 hypothetical protein [Solwaraspora sp. WMMD406]